MLKRTAAAAVFLASVSAHAQPEPLGVWDSRGQFVGNLVGQDRVELEIAGRSFAVSIQPIGPSEGAELLYATEDCSGSPYLDASTLPIPGYIIKGVIIYPGPLTTIEAKATGGYNSLGQFGCSPWDHGTRTVATEQTAARPVWTPPFCVSATKVRCE
jgi:hypothetical protein